jgi:hypothetical protein
MIAKGGNYGQQKRIEQDQVPFTRCRLHIFSVNCDGACPSQKRIVFHASVKVGFIPVHHAAQHNDMWNGVVASPYARVNACVSHEPFLLLKSVFCVSTLEKSW